MLDNAPFVRATLVTPRRINLTNVPSRWMAVTRGSAFHVYSTSYLIDLDHAMIVYVEATASVHRDEVTAQRRMIG